MSDIEEAVPVPESDDDNEAIVATVIDDAGNDNDEEEEDEDDGEAQSETHETNANVMITEMSTRALKDAVKREKRVATPKGRRLKEENAEPSSPTSETPGTESKKRKRKLYSKKHTSDEIPSIKDLGIPFRAVKRIMKVDKDIGTVQNEAAMVATYAAELFLEKLVKESNARAKKKGRNTVKYEDLGEVRASHSNLSFLDTLIP